VIFDTGTTLSYIPSIMYDNLMDKITHKRSVQDQGVKVVKCSERDLFPSVWLHINTTWFEMTPKYYVIDISGLQEEGQDYGDWTCILGFSPGNMYLLGDSFLKNYYSIHDNQNSRIGFAPSKTSDAVLNQEEDLMPTKKFVPAMSTTIWDYLLTWFIEVVVLGAFFVAYYYLFEAGLIDWETLLGKTAASRTAYVNAHLKQ
jgi:hypothetical protein